MIPNTIRFTEGLHKGITFVRGTGPAQRVLLGGGINYLVNSKNFWYNGDNKSVSADYLAEHKKEWVRAD
jgi:hypothetical protein